MDLDPLRTFLNRSPANDRRFFGSSKRRRLASTSKSRKRRSRVHEALEHRQLLAADVVINELMYRPSSQLDTQEYIELFNRGDASANLNNWQLNSGVQFTFPNVTLGAGQYLVVAANTAAFQAKYPGVTNFIGSWVGSLSNSGETVKLVNATGGTISAFTYASEGDWGLRVPGPVDFGHYGWEWGAGHDGLGKSMELVNPALSNDLAANWKSSITENGTPGAVNSVFTNNAAPIISDLKQFPIIPRSTDQVTITVKVKDELAAGISSVQVKYRVDGTIPYSTATMLDNGLNGDGDAGDGVYGAKLPTQLNNKVVEYYVVATDSSSLSREYPAPASAAQPNGMVLPRLLYQVNDLYNPNAVWTPGSQPLSYFVMTEVERAELVTIAQNSGIAGSNSQMDATFIYVDGTGVDVRYNAGIRNRGHGSRSGPPSNYDISFPNDKPWNDKVEYIYNKDHAWLQVLGNTIFEVGGLVAYDAQHSQLRVNNSLQATSGGTSVYAAQEAPDANFAAKHFPDDGNGNLYRMMQDDATGQLADLAYRGESFSSYTGTYIKETNKTENDYSDIIALTKAINNFDANNIAQPAGIGYLARISSSINVDQWVNYLAVNALIENSESGLYGNTVKGDDYHSYRGILDPRFQLVPHDLDTIFNLGSETTSTARDIFAYTAIPAFAKFLTAPEIMPLYYKAYVDQINNMWNHTVLDPIIDRLMTPVVSQGVISNGTVTAMKQFITDRTNGVLAQIQQNFSVPAAASVAAATRTISGTASVVETRSVLVNGQLATWDPKLGTYSLSVPLQPGVNRILVQTFDGFGGTGNELKRGFTDVTRTGVAGTNVSGTLTAGTTINWTAANGPYNVTADVTVPASSTLVIQPGTSVYFSPGTSLIVNGRLNAQGTELAPIRFTHPPTGPATATWKGINFNNTTQDNIIKYAVLEWGGDTSNNGMVGVTNSVLTIDRAYFDNALRGRIRTSNSSLKVTNSTFTDIYGVGVSPPAANNDFSEQITGSGILASGQFVIDGNTFGTTKGHNDIIDFDSSTAAGAPLAQILNNTFNGGGDDAIDMTARALIEGNTFVNFSKDGFNTDPGPSSTISGNGGTYTVVRNTFRNSSRAVDLQAGGFLTFDNNTVVNLSQAVIDFNGNSAGANLNGDIFQSSSTIFANIGGAVVTVNRSIVPASIVGMGVGNSTADPRLVNVATGDLHLKAGSPAIGTGPNGLDMGAFVPAGASISGEPAAQTSQNNATLVVGGPGIVAYKYRVNGGAWSAETPVATPISLTGLTNGAYTVQVAGKNAAGVFQADAAATTSKTWTVNSSLSKLLINEVLASNNTALSNGGTFPDAIELYNAGAAAVNLLGMSISDTAGSPTKYVFTNSTTLDPGEYTVIYADAASAAPGIHLGFSLSGDGEGVFLYNSAAAGGTLIDSVQFGQQIADLSIGRVGQDRHWALTQPTLGTANVEIQTGDGTALEINEWFASGNVKLSDDFVELYNPDSVPAALGGLYLTDNTSAKPLNHQIAPLSFVAAGGFVRFIADGKASAGPAHVNFNLSPEQELPGLFTASGKLIDKVIYFPQTTDYSQGRSPDGSNGTAPTYFPFFAIPTPGASNSLSTNPTYTALLNGLRITEIMYNPLGGPNTEYIELQNVGATTLDLTGVRLASGIDFLFPAMNLAPGARTVVVGDLAAFQARYGTSLNVAGQFAGSLSNGGEEIDLLLPVIDVAILRFSYGDASWYPTTDGPGFSLVINSGTAAPSTWDSSSSWHASAGIGGSPGGADPFTTAALTGKAFSDLNANGILAAPEVGLAGVTAQLYSAGGNGQIGGGDDVLARTVTSDSAGDYSFFNLPIGTYYLQFTAPGGFMVGPKDQGADDSVDSDADPTTGQTAVFNLAASQYDTSRDVSMITGGVSVAGRFVFYNNSVFDGNNVAGNTADDIAIATDKSALLPNQLATFANYTSFSQGINGIFVDISHLAGTPTASDFIFRVGNTTNPASWSLASAPLEVVTRVEGGVNDASRVSITWADGAIQKQWLQVTVKATAATGLTAPDVFYFGNAVGETGNTAGSTVVDASDEVAARNNPKTFVAPATITDHYDINRDGFVNAADQILARSNAAPFNVALILFTPPAGFELQATGGANASQMSQSTAGSGDLEFAIAHQQAFSAPSASLAATSQPAVETYSVAQSQSAASAVFASFASESGDADLSAGFAGAEGPWHSTSVDDAVLELLSDPLELL